MLSVGARHQVDLQSYVSEFHRVSDGLIYLDRTLYRQKVDRFIDVLGRFWAFSIARVSYGQVCAHRKGRKLTCSGTIGVFVPPYNMIDWEFAPGSLRFESYISVVEIPKCLPREAVVFVPTRESFPVTIAEIFECVQSGREFLPIGKEERSSVTARKAKEQIDSSYLENVSLAEVAGRIGVTPPDMAKAFRQCYGCPPVSYRNKLRVMDSLWKILTDDASLSETAFDVGFNDVSRFNKQFREHIRTNPSRFKP